MLEAAQRWFRDLPFTDPLRREQAILLQRVIVILIATGLVGGLSSLTAVATVDRVIGVASSLTLALVLLGALGLLRRGVFKGALLIVVVSVLALVFANTLPAGLEGARAIFTLLTIPLVLTGFVTGGRALVIVLLLSIAVVIGLAALEILTPQITGYSDHTYDPLLTCMTYIVGASALTLLISSFGSTLRGALQRSQQHERDLLVAMERAEAANRAKTTFLMTMSHELRTPLNAIVGYSEMLLEQAESDGQPDYCEDLNGIRAAGVNLTAIIQDILDMANLESGTLVLTSQPFVIEDLLSELQRAFDPLAAARTNRFELKNTVTIEMITADRAQLRQVLWKLLDNANKFTEGGTITLSAQVEARDVQTYLRIEVADTGIGIPAARLQHIFVPFSQGDMSATRRYGGSGLGLAISHGICRLMQGELTVESQEQRGSIFCLRIPLQHTAPSLS